MGARLVVVTGTGTGIGKTHVSVALLHALGRAGVRAAGVKPVESGVSPRGRPDEADGPPTDSALLAGASSFHVKHSCVALEAPISPHRAARLEGVSLDLADLARAVEAVRPLLDILVVELAGGLFTPLTDAALNADLAQRLAPDFLLLVAPDRLGVLHDVLATVRASAAMRLRLDGIVLVTPPLPDDSTGTNASELALLTRTPVVTTVPRGSPSTLADADPVRLIARAIQGSPSDRAPA
jgi:dethiobiotin synthetase